MKQLLIIVLFFALSFQADFVLSADLSSNIIRRVNSANDSLDKVEDLIQRNRAELTENHLKNARQEYDNIFNYYGSSFDHNHPTIVALKQRIETLTKETQGAQTPITKPNQPATKTKADDLIPNIRRLMGMVEGTLNSIDEYITAGRYKSATYAVSEAKQKFNEIAKRYPGLYDPNHPELLALKARIDQAEQLADKSSLSMMGTKPVEAGHIIVGMPEAMGDKLRNVAVHLSWLSDKLSNARKAEESAVKYGGPKLATLANHKPLVEGELQEVERLFSEFNRDFSGQFDLNHPAYVQVKNRIVKANQDVAQFMTDLNVETKAIQKVAADKHQAEVKAIMSKYKNMEPVSKLHAANQGRIVWATVPIGYKAQDSIKVRDSFKLSDPIFGRIYLHQSLGNTPVYSSGGGKPSDNYEFRYEFRLFVDGTELKDKFDVFATGKLNGEAGQSWTTWQFAPNPLPYDDSFKTEAEAWRNTMRGVQPGEHKVRFELWATQGQFKSREPVSIGEFTLLVGKDDRIVAGGSFPADSHSDGDTDTVRAEMMKAIVGPIAKPGEIHKMAVTSDWRYGVYSDTKRRYRAVSGAVLWRDKDGDGVCRYTSYNFVSEHIGGNDWTPAKYKSFCLNCPEGDVECPR